MTLPQEDRARRADAEALLERHLPMVRGYVLHLLSSRADAEDVVQELCVAVLANPLIMLRGAEPGAYLRGIARHLAGRHLRRAMRPRVVEDLVEAAWGDDTALDVEAEQAALRSCLGKLPARLRLLLDRRYHEGLTSRQIGERANLTGDAVQMSLMRCGRPCPLPRARAGSARWRGGAWLTSRAGGGRRSSRRSSTGTA